ncbi:hypothetical protein GCM10010916_06870 [Paenibacillus abyssi]|uniref:Uncharacterized protein n=1 Tax=Paenibacillus abyssi TaxID=1340531 RepID=A0A917CNN4_9BACL|nr:hypothetical protein GCM10010916_06870 [Paenibacillus abyssi]
MRRHTALTDPITEWMNGDLARRTASIHMPGMLEITMNNIVNVFGYLGWCLEMLSVNAHG